MASLPPNYLKTVVAIGKQSTPEEVQKTGRPVQSIATGFLYAYPIQGTMGKVHTDFRLWLVTCKHVLSKAKKANLGKIVVRLNRLEQRGTESFPIHLHQDGGSAWTEHPTADVAVISVLPQALESQELRWELFFAKLNALTREQVAEAELSEGDGVFMLGFPTGWVQGKQDYPVVRHAVLAQAQGWLNKEHDTFLLDGSGFPGNSGGPVVTAARPPFPIGKPSTAYLSSLIGMVTGRKLSGAVGSGEFEDVSETADLVVVTPMDAIDETIELAMSKPNPYCGQVR